MDKWLAEHLYRLVEEEGCLYRSVEEEVYSSSLAAEQKYEWVERV